jgi:hypothetical protein
MPPVYETLLLNTVVPQIQAAQAGDSYVIVVNATTPALRITQTGTGDSILVEDAANPDSSPFVVTAAGDVGIGTNAPTLKLEVVGSAVSQAIYDTQAYSFGTSGPVLGFQGLDSSSTKTQFAALKASPASANPDRGFLNVITRINGVNTTTLQIGTGLTGDILMPAGNLGIGTSSPGYKLDVQIDDSTAYNPVSGSVAVLRIGNNYGSAGNTQALITHYCSNYSSVWNAGLVETSGGAYTGAYIIQNRTGASTYAERLRLDSSGNLGLGVTPSAWNAGHTAMQIAFSGAIHGSDSGNNLLVNSNAYFDSVGAFRYIQTGFASSYEQNSGQHRWSTASSGTAGNVISFTQVLTLDGIDGSGYGKNLKLGGTADRATTKGTHHFDIFDGTAPVGTLANGISFYSAAGEAYVMDAAGNATLISPHDFETNEWIFRSKHTPSGKVLRIDVERLLRFVNTHFGLDAVKEFVEE